MACRLTPPAGDLARDVTSQTCALVKTIHILNIIYLCGVSMDTYINIRYNLIVVMCAGLACNISCQQCYLEWPKVERVAGSRG